MSGPQYPPSPAAGIIRVLIVDDSKVARLQLKHLLEKDSRIQVLGMVADGKTAIDFIATEKPDVVLMDIHMPGMDGFETTRKIMETKPAPIVICSGTVDPADTVTAFKVLEAGAVACVEKPGGPEHPNYERRVMELRETIRLMSEVKVVRRWPQARRDLYRSSAPTLPSPVPSSRITKLLCVAIGASTGGPPVLQSILTALPANFPAPILIVQHIAAGFLPGLIDWLNQSTSLAVEMAVHRSVPMAGHVYLAPDDCHLTVDAQGRMILGKEPTENGLRPAVSQLFRSVAACFGSNSIGILLTGMGRDGAAELKLLRQAGAVTVAQNRETSVVHGMPGEAILLGAAEQILSPDEIAQLLLRFAPAP